MTVKPLSELSLKELAGWALLIATGAGLGSFSQQTINPPRPDPFTSTEAKAMELRIREHFDRRLTLEIQALRLEVRASLIELRASMPPAPTRSRIRAIEDWIRKQDPDYKQPSSQWSVQ